jgi:hypothetical protein
MKKYISISMIATLGLFTLSLNSCKDCDGENPRGRIINDGTKVVSVQIKTSGGNTENLNNVDAGITSDYRSYSAGKITFTISVDKIDYVKDVDMSSCYEYDIKIDSNNNISTISRDRND